ncbi:MAG: hypothetical protein PHP51_01180 [Desulfotomaculaceae bacterium]|nr:hypothetical protein [Desulfotomaculaceae bacterium]MDD4767331.1 hypothetical protein [Desulfotomaculaceae bacterium]
MDFSSAVIPYTVIDVVAAFQVAMSDQAKRAIVLTKEKSGAWDTRPLVNFAC